MYGEADEQKVESRSLLTAMVVDDSGTLRAAINRFMQATGFVERVVEAVDGFDAIKVLGSAPIDIIICDVMMPGCDGLQFLQLKSKYPEYKDIPVVMLTSEDDAETVVACLEAGASDHIRKPIQKDEFVARLRVHCGLKLRQEELIALSDQLSDSRSFLDNIINSLTDGLVVIDKDEKIVQCNESILSLLGFVSSKSVIGAPIQKLIAEDDLLWMLGFSQLLRQGPFTGMSARFLHQNGKQITMSVSASQIQGNMGKKTFSIVLLRNIQEAQDILAYESRELAEEKESKSQFSELRFQISELRTKLEDQSFHDSLMFCHGASQWRI